MEEKRLRLFLAIVLVFAALCLALPIGLSRRIHVESEGPTRLRVGPDHQVRVVAGGRLHVLAGDGSLRASYPLADFGLMSVLSDLVPLAGGDFFAAQAEPPSVWRCNEQSRSCNRILQPDEYLGPNAAALFLAWEETSRRLAVADNFEHRLLLLDGDGKLLDISSRQTLSLSFPQKLLWLGPRELAVVDTSRTRIVGVSLDRDRFGPLAWSDSAALAAPGGSAYRATRWLDRGPDGSWWTLNSRPDFGGTRVVKITPGAGSPQGFEAPTKEELADLAWFEGRLLVTDVGGWRVRSLDAMGKPGADFGDAAFRAALDAGARRQAFWVWLRRALQAGVVLSLLTAIRLAWKLTRLQTANAAENPQRDTETPLAELPDISGAEPSIRLEFSNDYDYVLNSIRANLSRSWRRILPAMEWILTLFWGLYALLTRQPLEMLTTLGGGIDLAVFLMLLLTALGLTPSFQTLVVLLGRLRASRPPIAWHVNSRGLDCAEGEAFTAHMSWQGIYGVDRLQAGFLVLLTQHQVVWFPCNGFASIEEIKHFETWARRSAPRYRALRTRQWPQWLLSLLLAPVLLVLCIFLAETWDTGTPLHESYPLLIKPSGWFLTGLAWNTAFAAPLFYLLSRWTTKWWAYVLTGAFLGTALYGLCRYSAWIEPSFALMVAYALIGAMHWWLVHSGQPQ